MAQWKAQGNLNGRAVTQKIVLSAQQEYTAKEIKGGNGIVLCQLDYSSVRLWVSGNNDFSTATELSITLRGKKWNFTDGAGNAVLYETFYIWTQGTSAKDIILEVSSDSEGIDYYLGNSSINQSQIESYSSYAVQQMREIQDKPTTTNPLEVDTNISLENVNVCLVGSTAYAAKLAEIAALEAQLATISGQLQSAFNALKDSVPNPNNHKYFVLFPNNSNRSSNWRKIKKSTVFTEILYTEVRVDSAAYCSSEGWVESWPIGYYGTNGSITNGGSVELLTFISGGTFIVTKYVKNIRNGDNTATLTDNIVTSGNLLTDIGPKFGVKTSNNKWSKRERGQVSETDQTVFVLNDTVLNRSFKFTPMWLSELGTIQMTDEFIDKATELNTQTIQALRNFQTQLSQIESPLSLKQQIAQKRAELNSIVATDAKLNLKLNQYAYATILNLKIEGVNMIKLPVTGTSDSVGGFLCYATAKLVNPTPFPQILQFVTRSMLAIDDTDIAEALITIEFLSLAETDRINAILNDINAQASGYNTDNARNMAIKYTSGSGQVSKLVGSWDSLGDLINSITLSGRQNYSEIIKVLDSNSGLGILATCQVFTKNQQTANVAPLNLNLRHCIEIHLVGNKKPSAITHGGI